MNIGIVGLGLIGGSMARSIKARTPHSVWGSDIDSEVMAAARLCGAIDAPLTDENIASCDLILTAVLPRAAVEWALAHGPRISRNTILIDLCGIKRGVCRKLAAVAGKYGFTYIGGHPMAGKEKWGFANSTDSLFNGAFMILTPDEGVSMPLLEKLKRFFTAIGFVGLTITTPEEHDRVIAYTSQLAHITSSAYVKSPEAQRHCGLSAGSFRDLTRVARLDPDMWVQLMMGNADFLAEQLELLIGNLNKYLSALRDGDTEGLRLLLKDGCEKKALAGGS